MSFTVLLCTDGSDLATAALEHGLDALRPADRIVIATVIELVDPMLVTGTGMAGGVISASELETLQREREDAAADLLTTTRERLGVPEAEGLVLAGAPGPQLVELATNLPASVLVLGTRGHGGLRRAFLGSVSDHVIRNAPCPVVTSTHEAAPSE